MEVIAEKLEARNLDRSRVRAIAWMGATQWVVQIMSWFSTIYVARVLTPNDYGVVAMAMIYLGFITLVSDLGVGSSVVVLRDLGGRELSELNTISVIAGFFWLATSWIASYYIGAFFSSGE